MPSEPRKYPKCAGDSDGCTLAATTTRDTSGGFLAPTPFCETCALAYDAWIDNYDPPDQDGEDMCRDYQAEERDRMDAARRLK